MESTETDKRTLVTVVVRNPIRPIGVGDVNLNYHQVRCVVECERLHMFVHNHGVVVSR
jgi:hypothetical protein